MTWGTLATNLQMVFLRGTLEADTITDGTATLTGGVLSGTTSLTDGTATLTSGAITGLAILTFTGADASPERRRGSCSMTLPVAGMRWGRVAVVR